MKEEENKEVWKRSPNIARLPPRHPFKEEKKDDDVDENARMFDEDEEYNENCSDGE